jgi:hypothetical protein
MRRHRTFVVRIACLSVHFMRSPSSPGCRSSKRNVAGYADIEVGMQRFSHGGIRQSSPAGHRPKTDRALNTESLHIVSTVLDPEGQFSHLCVFFLLHRSHPSLDPVVTAGNEVRFSPVT